MGKTALSPKVEKDWSQLNALRPKCCSTLAIAHIPQRQKDQQNNHAQIRNEISSYAL